VIATVLYGYLALWALTTIGLALLARRKRPLQHPAPVTIAAGAAWPVLLVGAAQLGAVALAAEAVRRRRPEVAEQSPPDEAEQEAEREAVVEEGQPAD
jgi:hypothetical protein